MYRDNSITTGLISKILTLLNNYVISESHRLCLYTIFFYFVSVLLAVVSICTAIAAWHWLTDPLTPVVSLTQSLWNHPFFAFTSTFLGDYFLIFIIVLSLNCRVTINRSINGQCNDFHLVTPNKFQLDINLKFHCW